MGKVTTYKRGIAAFISSEKGQRFFNFAYSIGAAIVIWGALFKILHLPGGNALLSIGMGTEVLMFVLTAFDRPPKEYKWEDVFPVLDSKNPEDRPDFSGGGGGIVVGGTATAGASFAELPDAAGHAAVDMPTAAAADATREYIDQIASISGQLQALKDTTEQLNSVSQTLLQSVEAIAGQAQAGTGVTGYADQMQALSHNLGGLNSIYELQLKSVAAQLESIDRATRGIKDIKDMYEKAAQQSMRYCEETEKMARYIQQLNAVYEKMLHAMTVNMPK